MSEKQHFGDGDPVEMKLQSVPDSWELIEFESAFELVSANDRKVPSSEYLPEGLLPVVDQGQQFIGGFTDKVDLAIEPGDGLLVFGDHTRIFKPIDFPFAAGADGIKILRPRAASMKYSFYACSSLQFPKKGYARHYSHLRKCKFPVAPQKEQTRIVSKIDELFSQIENGELALDRARRLVERYRQSVLKAAVTGELTREWREQHLGDLESGEVMLARILEARRRAWETSELSKMEGKGRRPVNDVWKKAYVQPDAPIIAAPSLLPEGWTWVCLDQISTLITSGSRGWKDYYSESGSVFIRAQDIKRDLLDLSEVAFVDVSNTTEGLRTRVASGDLLITITGANVAKSAIVTQELEEAYVSQHVALVRPSIRGFDEFLYYWIISASVGRKQLLDAAYGAGKPGLSLADLKSLQIALPSEREQKVICEKLSIELSRLSALSMDADAQMKSARSLRKAVLKAAFSGALVPQSTEDEPASSLLECIAVERAAKETKSKRRFPSGMTKEGMAKRKGKAKA